MALFSNFGKKNNTPAAPAAAPAPTVPAQPTAGHEVTLDLAKGGILNLQKNDFLDLSKVGSTLENIRVSAGWDVNKWGSDYDLDLCAVLLGADGRLVRNTKNLVYYGSKQGEGVQLDHDNLTGEGDGDDENMFVNFSRISPEVHKVIVCVVIYSARTRGQSFKNVRNAYVRLVDQATRPEKEICRYNLTEDGGNATAVQFAELTRNPNGWSFKALGNYVNASIEDIRNSYR